MRTGSPSGKDEGVRMRRVKEPWMDELTYVGFTYVPGVQCP